MQLKSIKQKLKKNQDAVRYIRTQKWGWTGHIPRLTDDRRTYRTTFWQPIKKKRNKGKQKRRWKDDIEKFLGGKKFSNSSSK